MIKKSLQFLTIVLLVFTFAFPYVYCQDKVVQQQPLHFVKPMVDPVEPYGIQETVVNYGGPFDNIQLNSLQSFGETDIAVNPNIPVNFVGGDNRAVLSSGNVYYTSDGGNTWNTASTGTTAGDPVFTCDYSGNFYYGVINNSVSGFIVYKSTNQGQTWNLVASNNYGISFDKEWMAADQTNGPYSNNLYASYSNFSQPVTITFVKSVNGGSTWSSPVGLFGPASCQGSCVAVGPNGRVYVAWMSGGAMIKYSTDGGNSFNSNAITISPYSEPGNINYGRQCLKTDIRVNGFPHLAVDETSGAYSGNVYCCFAMNPPGPDNADIYFCRSTDGGNTWSTRMRVNDDIGLNDQWMPGICVDNQGRVWIDWWDSRSDSANNMLTETWGAVSTDGGQTFSTNYKISNHSFNPSWVKISQGSGQAYYIGDYQGTSGKSVVLPLWTDGRDATGSGQYYLLRDYTFQLPGFGVYFSKPVDSVQHGYTESNRLVIPVAGPYTGTITFNANVSPSPSPGTITFTWNPSNVKTMNGNPDSIQINANVSANVPYQTYTVTVNGTESANIRTITRSYTLVVANMIGINNPSRTASIFSLRQNYPNPFNPSTQIDYSVAKYSLVNLKVYDVLGQEVAALIKNEWKVAGSYDVEFNAENYPSGVYYYKLTAGDFTDVKKMILVK